MEYGHWLTGVRAEGVIWSGSTFVMKVCSGFITGSIGWLLGFAGYDGMAVEQTKSALDMITALYVGAPVVCFIIMAIFGALFSLEKYMGQIGKAIEAGEIGNQRKQLK